jgi:hypothetical protein
LEVLLDVKAAVGILCGMEKHVELSRQADLFARAGIGDHPV